MSDEQIDELWMNWTIPDRRHAMNYVDFGAAVRAAVAAEKARLSGLIFEQAKKCQTSNGAAMLLAVKNYVFESYPSVDGINELWQVADHLCGKE